MVAGTGQVVALGTNHESYALLEAWHWWWLGRLRASDLIAGIPIFWWGRAGKCAEIAATLLLLWDGMSSAWFTRFSEWIRAWDRWMNSSDSPYSSKPNAKEPFGGMIVYLLLTVTPLWLFLNEPRVARTLDPWFTWCTANWVRVFFVFAPSMGLLSGGGMFTCHFVIIKPIIKLCNLPTLPRQLRIAAVCLLVLGFHFSLLAL
jgi:hypothetical protein